MRTAQEMYQYCVHNGFGEGMNKAWGLKHFSLIEHALSKDEQAIMCFIGLHNYISPTKHDSNFAYAITNKRIVMAQQKVLGQNFQTVNLDNLNDITAKIGVLVGVITIDTVKERFNIAMHSGVAKNINNVIHDTLLSIKRKQSLNDVGTSTADEILKYKKLLDMGIITQAEFTKKKKDLMDM